jgi:hypothetical protein
VHVDGNIGVYEVLETAGVIEVQMALNNYLDVFDVVASCFDCGGKLVLFFVFYTRKYIN